MKQDSLEIVKFKLCDFLLYNHKQLLELVLREEYGMGIGDGCRDNSTDSQIEMFVNQQQYRLYIINITANYLYDMSKSDYHRFLVYRLVYEERWDYRTAAREILIDKGTVTNRVRRIREGLLDEWEESGIIHDSNIDNVIRFKKKYNWIEEKEKQTPA